MKWFKTTIPPEQSNIVHWCRKNVYKKTNAWFNSMENQHLFIFRWLHMTGNTHLCHPLHSIQMNPSGCNKFHLFFFVLSWAAKASQADSMYHRSDLTCWAATTHNKSGYNWSLETCLSSTMACLVRPLFTFIYKSVCLTPEQTLLLRTWGLPFREATLYVMVTDGTSENQGL